MAVVHVLSAGAAKGLVTVMTPAFERETGHRLQCAFGAVGAMQERLDAGDPCDLIILSHAMISALAQAGRVRGEGVVDLGRVHTGIAVCTGAPRPELGDAAALRRALLGSSALHVPDTVRSTAGRHALKVLAALGVKDRLAARMRAYPNGATAMATMAAEADPLALGLTQITEILYTPGVVLAAALPREFELATVYTVAVSANARQPDAALALARCLASPAAAALRLAGGFDPT